MTIIVDPKTTKATPVEAVQRDVEAQNASVDERAPLLPPPSYTPSSNPSSAPAPSPRPLLAPRAKKLGVIAGLTAIALAILTWMLFRKGGPSEGRTEDWMLPPAGYKATTPKPITFPSNRHTHEPTHSWPNQPLFSRTTVLDLPLTSSSNYDFFLHALGVDAVGKVSVVPKTSKVNDGVVNVEVVAVYASEETLNERIRIWKVIDDDGRPGIDILTPTQQRRWTRRSIDYISFEVTIFLPSGLNSFRSSSLALGSFDGKTNGMSLAVADLAKDWSFKAFDYTTANSAIVLKGLNSDRVNLLTTNGRITASGTLNSTTIRLTSTNADIDLQQANVRAEKIKLHSTNGRMVARDAEEHQGSVIADSIEIRTTNDPIYGTWEAKSIDIATTNGEIKGLFAGIERKLKLETTNAHLTATISLSPSLSSSSPSSIPVSLSTTSHPLAVVFSPLNGYPYKPIDATFQTTNGALTVENPWFVGDFEFSTTNPRVVTVQCEEGEGRKLSLDGDRKISKGWLKGSVVDSWDLGKKKGVMKGSSTNGDLKLQL